MTTNLYTPSISLTNRARIAVAFIALVATMAFGLAFPSAASADRSLVGHEEFRVLSSPFADLGGPTSFHTFGAPNSGAEVSWAGDDVNFSGLLYMEQRSGGCAHVTLQGREGNRVIRFQRQTMCAGPFFLWVPNTLVQLTMNDPDNRIETVRACVSFSTSRNAPRIATRCHSVATF